MTGNASRILHRRIESGDAMPVVVGGRGLELVDAQGRVYLDASGGAAVSCLGHGEARVAAAMKAQIDRIAYAHTSFFTSEPAEALAARLVADAPAGIERALFVSGGSEAMEAALKLTRQFHLERGEGEREVFVARRQSYHGATLGALAVGGNAMRRSQFAPLLFEARHVAPPYAYRDRRAGESEAAYGDRLVDEIEEAFAAIGPGRVAAFVAETVGGATQGCTCPPPGYFARIRALCDRAGALLVLDEVMCGMGRTGTLHACAQEGAAPDILAVAKGLGGGYQPIGALLIAGRVVEALAQGSGAFLHGHTYLAHPVACAAALAVQEAIAADGLLDNVRARGAQLEAALRARLGGHRHVGDIRGRGLFFACEFVADRASKAPFAPERGVAARVKAEAMARGLLCYAMAGTIDGRTGDHAMLAPPFIVTAAQIEEIVGRFAEAVEAGTGAA
ncbi:MAG: aspartate aminotransferase family protein [Methylobacteriaceae bacterium]|nr:aspartate aminotransferase family protein [Methylobacteriaceae bacterium]